MTDEYLDKLAELFTPEKVTADVLYALADCLDAFCDLNRCVTCPMDKVDADGETVCSLRHVEENLNHEAAYMRKNELKKEKENHDKTTE